MTLLFQPGFPKKHAADSFLYFRRFFLFCGLFLFVSEIIKQWYLTFVFNQGQYDWWYFPFQLCSIPMYILLVLPHRKSGAIRNTFLSFLMNYGLLGGIAVFADTSGLHYPVPFLTIHSYLWHILLILTGLAAGLVFLRQGTLSVRIFFDGTLVYLVCCLIATVLNCSLHRLGEINMFYINPFLPVSQIFFRDLAKYIGNTLTIFCYITATILGAGTLFLFWKKLIRFYSNKFL